MITASRFLALLAWPLGTVAFAVLCQAAQPEYKPAIGEKGKDVIWVPTGQALVNRMLTMAKVTANDYVVDLGSGDGRLVIPAAHRYQFF